MKHIFMPALVIFSLFTTILAEARGVTVDFDYSVTYESGNNFSKKPKATDIKAAIEQARSEAWRIYLRRVSDADRIRYVSPENKAKIEASISDLVSIEGQPQTLIDEQTRTIRVGGVAVIDTAGIRVLISESVRSDDSNKKKMIGFLILPRLQASTVRREFSPETERTDGSTNRTMTEKVVQEGIAADSNGVSERVIDANKTGREDVTRSSGIVTERRESQVATWAKVSASDASTAKNFIAKAFTNSGFRATEYGQIASRCGGPSQGEIIESMIESDSILDRLKSEMLDAASPANNCFPGEYFVFGTIDIDSIEKVQGKYFAQAVVNIEVSELGGWSSIIGTVADRARGDGDSEDEARTDAIKNAAEYAAKEVVSAFINNR